MRLVIIILALTLTACDSDGTTTNTLDTTPATTPDTATSSDADTTTIDGIACVEGTPRATPARPTPTARVLCFVLSLAGNAPSPPPATTTKPALHPIESASALNAPCVNAPRIRTVSPSAAPPATRARASDGLPLAPYPPARQAPTTPPTTGASGKAAPLSPIPISRGTE